MLTTIQSNPIQSSPTKFIQSNPIQFGIPKYRKRYWVDSSVWIWHNRSARENPVAHASHVKVIENHLPRKHAQIVIRLIWREKSEKFRPQCNWNSVNWDHLQQKCNFLPTWDIQCIRDLERYSRENSGENFENDRIFLDSIVLCSRV